MKFIIVAVALMAGQQPVSETTHQPVLAEDAQGRIVLAANALETCSLDREVKKKMLKTCVYKCSCGEKTINKKGFQGCAATAKFQC